MRRASLALLVVVICGCSATTPESSAVLTPITSSTAASSTTVSTTTPSPVRVIPTDPPTSSVLSNTPPDTEVFPDAATVAFFQTVGDAGVRRWQKPTVTVSWVGEQSATDAAVLDSSAQWLSSLSGLPKFLVVQSGSESDITFHRLVQSQWAGVVGADHADGSTDGVTLATWSSDGEMRHADVVVDTESSQFQRNRTIIHEFIHAVGSGHHECAGGLVYGGRDYDPRWTPVDFDSVLLQLLYNKAVPAASTASEAVRIAEALGLGAACPKVEYKTVSSDTGVFWCQTTGDVRLCQATSDAVGPHSGAATVRWLRDGVMYDYDPLLYTTFRYEKARLLCRIPKGDGSLSPCQKTTGSVVVVPELWTDGTSVYDHP